MLYAYTEFGRGDNKLEADGDEVSWLEEDSRQKMIEKELEKTQDGKNVITLGRINENSNIQNKTAVITNVTFVSHSLPLPSIGWAFLLLCDMRNPDRLDWKKAK